ncbi:cation diffusion facilitator family transporter [Povalibacter sp.]|uniref:cation diffusion facilitator family transporter n=1 Tax=Povalibacter sp. TaxID=1962978 RepID=UPI002F4050CD
MARQASSKVVYAALLGNVLIATTKFGAAFWTGSSAMLSEAVHSLVDTSNELLLLYGMRRARQPADAGHPFGHGRELYFWSFIVALMVFGLGAGVSFYEGIHHILHPEPIDNPLVNYVVLGLSLVFESASWWIAFRQFRATKGGRGYLEAVGVSKDPTTFTVLFEDSAALAGLLIALAGIACAQIFAMPVLDGVASLGIALVLAITGIALARRTKELLLGEQVYPELARSILAIAGRHPGVAAANGVIATQLGPEQVVALLSAEFVDRLTADEIEACVIDIESQVRASHPEVTGLFIKPQSAATWAQRRSSLAQPQ